MKHSELVGKIQTVLGPIEADSLGVTLVHEHLFMDETISFVEPANPDEKNFAYEPVQLSNLFRVRLNPFGNLDNLLFNDEEMAIKETMIFKSFGGGTITEVTPKGPMGRNPEGLVRVARKTGLNIIMGTGYYVAPSHPPELTAMTEEEITEELVQELTVGVGDTEICAGIIGEIGCNKPLDQKEKKVLRCCAAAQQRTGAAIYLHPSATSELVLENVMILKDAGADLGHVIVGHVCMHDFDTPTCHKLMDLGCFIGIDMFGLEGIHFLPHEKIYIEMNDQKRIKKMMDLINDGYLNHILLSQDVATKERLTSYGGFGYGHILRDIVPVLRNKGLSDGQIDTMLKENPKRALVFTSVKD